jgi:aminoglycoside 2'-N-acetyltransferase I
MEFRSRLAPMATLHAAPSDALDSTSLRDLRTLLDAAFDGDFSDEDWDHAIGGVHIWLKGSHGLISHASLVERTLSSSGESMRVGYVEAVATVAAERHKGYAATVMTHVDELIRRRYALGALSAGTHALYESLGWELWRGPTFVDGPHGRERTSGDDGGVMILRTPRSPRLDLDGSLVCDWRQGDVW